LISPMDGAAVSGCLSEVKAAIAGLEAATLAGLKSSEVRLHDAQNHASNQLYDAVKMSEEQAKFHKERLEVAEARIERLEQKLMSKRSEITALRDLAARMKAKLERKSEALLAIDDDDTNKRPETVKSDAALAIVAANGKVRDDSESTEAKRGRERTREGGGRDAQHGRRHGTTSERKHEGSPGGRAGNDNMSLSDESSADEPREQRRGNVHTKDRGRPRSQSRSRGGSRGHSSRSREGDCRYEERHRERRGHDSRSRRTTDRGSNAHHGEAERDESSSRSRSRRPWHSSSKVSKGKGKGDREPALCIAFVFSKCVWGDKCRERHPDPEDARLAKESLQNKVCRFGVECRRKDCVFRHPEGRRRDQDDT